MTRIFQSWKRGGRGGRVRAPLNTPWRAHLGAGLLSTQTCLVWLDCLPWLPTCKTWGPPTKIWISGFSSKAGHAGSTIPAGKSGRREQGCFRERTETSGLLPVVAHLHSLPGPCEPLSGNPHFLPASPSLRAWWKIILEMRM